MEGNRRNYKILSLLTIATLLQLVRFSESRPIPVLERNEVLNIDCTLCIDAVVLLRDAIKSNKTLQDVLPAIEPVCERVLRDIGKNGTYMCPGILKSYLPVVAYVVAQDSVQPSHVCAAFGVCSRQNGVGQPAVIKSEHDNYLNLPAAIHEVTRSMSQRRWPQDKNHQEIHTGSTSHTWEALRKRDSDSPTTSYQYSALQGTPSNRFQDDSPLRILQLTDIHLDIFYQQGSATDCGLYVCCRSWQPGLGHAGHYGDYKCDLPLATLDLMLDTVKSMDVDFIVYTGDNPPHDLWNETYDGQLLATKLVVKRLSEKLVGKLIYPALGNHETFPESEYLAQLPLYQNMTKAIAGYWKEWFPMSEEAADTISSGGYYTTKVRDGLRIVAINSNYGYWVNIYSLINQQNGCFYDHINWIHSVLSKAETESEKVLLLAHVPPCPKDANLWYVDFLFNITRRYHKTIVGFFAGHSHKDQIRLLQDEHGVYGAVMVAPSVTTYSHTNPSFRLYLMDKSTFQLLDYQQYYLNLTQANALALQGLRPEFELAYSASDEYGMDDLSTSSWSALAGRFGIYDSLLQRYIYNMDGRSRPYGKCDTQCQRKALCAINHPNLLEYEKCVIST